MRKIILIVLSMLVPFGLWTAGCRQDRDTAFPNTPEMNNLAQAPEAGNPTRPPVIPAAPIDRDILNLPERNTMARINATNDRANALAGSRVNPGLFVMPESGVRMAAVPESPGEQVWDPYGLQSPAPAMASVPAPSGREFWSRPAAPVHNAPRTVPGDVYAMAAPSPREAFIAPPPPVGAPVRGYGENSHLPPEDIPGIFLNAQDGREGGSAAHPPAVPGWIGMGDTRGDALGAPPLLSEAVVDSVPADSIGERMRQEAPESAKPAAKDGAGPLKLDLAGLLGSMRTIADAAVPAHEPKARAPEAAREVAAAEWRPTRGWSSAMAEPVGQKSPEPSRRIARARLDELREALAPLPDITLSGKRDPDGFAFRAAPVSMPEPMPEPDLSPALEAARSLLLEYTPEPREEMAALPAPEPALAMGQVFDDLMPMVPPVLDPIPVEVPEAPLPVDGERTGLAKTAVANIPAPEVPKASEGTGDKRDEPFRPEGGMPALLLPELPVAAQPERAEAPSAAQPQKIRLEPVGTAANRPEIAAVDASVEVPPLRF